MNVLMIMTDQQRWDSLGVTGAQGYATPNLDRLAGDGALFEACYCDNPVCTPSRASLFTGKPLPDHGVYRLHDILPEEETPFPFLLKQAGYKTALFGKWHLSGRIEEEKRRHPKDGFDIYEWCMEASVSLESQLNGYGRWLEKQNPAFYTKLLKEGRNLGAMPLEYSFTRWAADQTISFLDDMSFSGNDSTPWFCLMSVFDPHNPYDDAPRGYRERVGTVAPAVPDPVLTKTDIPGIRAELDYSYLGTSSNLSEEDTRDMRRGYAASLILLDDEVGRVLETLEKNGQTEETMVIFTSDHGDMLGDHGLYVKGAFFYDPCVRVPLIVRLPGILEKGTRIAKPVQLRDLAMTVMTAAGVPELLIGETGVDSRDLVSLAQGKSSARNHVICRYRNSGINDRGNYWNPPILGDMIRRDDWKLNRYHGDSSATKSSSRIQLFNLTEDPQELTNMATDFETAEIRRELIDILLAEWAREEMYQGSRGGDARPREDQKISNFQRKSAMQ